MVQVPTFAMASVSVPAVLPMPRSSRSGGPVAIVYHCGDLGVGAGDAWNIRTGPSQMGVVRISIATGAPPAVNSDAGIACCFRT